MSERTSLSSAQEKDFQTWYAGISKTAGISSNPDDPLHKYDYRGAFLAAKKNPKKYAPEVSPEDGLIHFPSEFKDPDHPNRFVKGVDTRNSGMGRNTDADFTYERLKKKGRSPQYIRDFLRSQGMDPSMVMDLNEEDDRQDVSGGATETWKTHGLVDYIKENTGIKIDPNDPDVLDLVRKGGIEAAQVNEAKDKFKQSLPSWLTTAVRRGQNLSELVLAGLGQLVDADRQLTFSWIRGDTKDEIMERFLDTPTPEDEMSPLPFTSAVDQLHELFRQSILPEPERRGIFDRIESMGMILDVEPQVFESMANDLTYQDVVIKGSFGGDIDSYNSWLQDVRTSKAGPAKLFGLGLLYSFEDMFTAPSVVVSEAVVAGTAAGKYLGALSRVDKQVKKGLTASKQGLGDVIDETKLIVAQDQLNKALNPLERTVGDVLEVRRVAEDLTKKAEGRLAANPGDVEAARSLVKRQKRLSEAKLALNRFVQPGEGGKTDIHLRKVEHGRLDDVIDTGQKTEQVRREVLANRAAPNKMVREALDEAGLLSKPKLQKRLDEAVMAIREGKGKPEHYGLIEQFERLPLNVREHLDVLKIGPRRLIRREALKTIDESPDGFWANPDAASIQQRLVFGPDDGEATGDAMRRLIEGGSLDDVKVRNAQVPEYSILNTVPDGWADGQFVREVADLRKGHKLVAENGTIRNVFSDPDQHKFMYGRGVPGLLEGSRLLSGHTLLGRGLRAIAFPLREPRGALRGTGIYERQRAGMGRYEVHTGGQMETWSEVLSKAGVAKKNRVGSLKIIDKEKNVRLFEMLDTNPGKDTKSAEKMAKLFDAASPGEREAYSEIRQWLDGIANRLGIAPNERITGYASHLFPDHLFDDGARPLEFLGIPVTSETPMSMLHPRLGKAGYAKDTAAMLDAYTRAAYRKIYVEPTLQDMLDLAKGTGSENVMKYTNNLVREMKGQPSGLMTHLDEVAAMVTDGLQGAGFPGAGKIPKPSEAAMAVSSLYYSSLLAGNLNYLTQNMGTGVLNPLAYKGALHTARGAMQMMTKEGRALAKASGVQRQWTKIYEGPFKEYADFMSTLGGPNASEFYVRGLSLHAALSETMNRSGRTWAQLVDEGLGPAVLHEAVGAAEFTQHVYGVAGRSPYFARALGKSGAVIGTQFLSFPYKQSGFLLSMAAENPGHAMRYFAYSGAIQRMAAEGASIDASQFVGLGYIPTPRANRPGPLSPGFEAIASMMDWQTALTGENPNEIDKAGANLSRSLFAAVPGLRPIEKAIKGQAELATGQVTRTGSAGQTENVRQLEIPEEALTSLLQVQSVQEKAFRQREQQSREQVNNRLFFMKKLAKEAVKAHNTQNYDDYITLREKLVEMGIFINGDPGVGAIEAQYLSRDVRTLMRNPLFVPPDIIPSIIERGIRERQ